ncbi:hypothetical protein NQ315_017324 [Exocentrus adspersus]|uniref:Uncharacterized protein n=1 Tax=Exocentrus adspersus TaxID=1586481 RepID=A0AAV8VE07_9CUCU|nr:hypothetical protein NQ315_017324 [Exocentrus adspersus]
MNFLILQIWLVTRCTAKEEDDSNEVSAAPSINLNVNLRKALLKALIELENEESNENDQRTDSERIVEKASASALSVFTSSEDISSTSSNFSTNNSNIEMVEDTNLPLILFQRSQAVEHSPITEVEKEELDPFNDAEQILTSASNSFTLPNSNSLTSDVESRSISKEMSNIVKDDKPTSTTERNIIEITTVTPTSSTEESDTKAEEVQFFTAPLVAAFTVHQDEQGIPKKG